MRTVHEAISNNLCASDIQGTLIVGVISEFLPLCDLVKNVILQPGIAGVVGCHIWRLSSNGLYSARSAYKKLFQGMSSLILEFGNPGLQENVNSSYGW